MSSMTIFEILDKHGKDEEGNEIIIKGTVYIIRWLPGKDSLEKATYSDSFEEIIETIKDAKKKKISLKEGLQIYSASFEEEGYALQPIDPWNLVDLLI